MSLNPSHELWHLKQHPNSPLNCHAIIVSLELILKQPHIVPDRDHCTAALSHIEHSVVVFGFDALLEETVLSEVALVVEDRRLVEVGQAGLYEGFKDFQVVVAFSELAQECFVYLVVGNLTEEDDDTGLNG